MTRTGTTRTILVVHPDTGTVSSRVELLQAARSDVTGSSSFAAARELLEKLAPHLLIAQVRLGAFNGLHLVLCRRAVEPTSASIVIDTAETGASASGSKRRQAGWAFWPIDFNRLAALRVETPLR